jgi:hypothetical protein
MSELDHGKIEAVLNIITKGDAWIVGDSPLLSEVRHSPDDDWDDDVEHAYLLEFSYHDADGIEYEYCFTADELSSATITPEGSVQIPTQHEVVNIQTFNLSPVHSTSSSEDPSTLRQQAAALLEKASALDGLTPYFIMHEHEYGVSPYMVWSESEPTEDQAAAALDEKFEPHKCESLHVLSMDSIAELTGTRTLTDMEASVADLDSATSSTPNPGM